MTGQHDEPVVEDAVVFGMQNLAMFKGICGDKFMFSKFLHVMFASAAL
jgi:hypothetical protein